MAVPSVDIAPLGRSASSKHVRLGWILLLTGAYSAVAIVALSIVVNRVACQNPTYEWAVTRTAICVGDAGNILLTIGEGSVAMLVLVAVVGGLGFGVLASRTVGFRASAWLLLSATIYASVLVWDLARVSSILTLGILQSMVFAPLSAVAALTVWLVLSAAAVGLGRLVRRPARR